MHNNALAVYSRLFEELKFGEILTNYALEVTYPQNELFLQFHYVIEAEGNKAHGSARLPTTVFPVEKTWREMQRLRAKLTLVRETCKRSDAPAAISSSR